MPAITSSRYTVQAGWDDVPHLDAKTKRELLDGTQPYLRDARSKGTPSLGAGAIYPIPLEHVTVAPFAIPPHWRRGYAQDVGWNRTACLWLAEDPADRTLYGYAEYYAAEAVPVIHATAIKARGEWITGAIDPASRGRAPTDGKQLLAQYIELGLHLVMANNAVDSGIHEVWTRLSTGRLRIFSTLQQLQAEYRLYRRDEKGKIVKEFDHLMDCLRYGVMTFDAIGHVRPAGDEESTTRRVMADIGGY